ncbi:putative bifunctional diguanylate cyclase/phosphodiesterase [Kineococcus sp. SYSU DK004]|uniref:putative bifunctional diguanylate cyclase/phosphodiesterase n=1 Tax=Kineococcus sp. SYSU DK004 TaxID=3383125 RepID=UPI003D7CE1E6
MGRAVSAIPPRTVATVGLTVVIALAATLLWSHVPEHPVLPGSTGTSAVVVLIVLFGAFFVTELGQALVEVRDQAYSFSLSGIPLLLGVLSCDPQHLIAVRVGAAVCAFAVQRASPVKFAFNTASYALDCVLLLVLVGQFAGTAPALTWNVAAACYLAMAVGDLVTSLLVLLVIRINSGRMRFADVFHALVPAAVFVVINVVVACTAVVLWQDGPLGVALLAALTATTAAAYRGYLVLRRRHQSLQTVQEFIDAASVAAAARDGNLVAQLLEHARTVLRARRVELVVGPAGKVRHHVVQEDGDDHAPAPADLLDELLADGGAHLLDASGPPAAARLLSTAGAGDALLVPVPAGGVPARLLVVDRVGDTTSFDRDDLRLLQAFAGHLGVRLQNDRLVDRLQHDATHDELTGLGNRALLQQRLAEAVPRGPVAVLLLDLDRFKEVNDTLGHPAGDELLQVVARRLRSVAPPGSTVVRLGGDEFAVLVTGGDVREAAEQLAVAVAEAVRPPVALADATVSTAVSTGIAVSAPGERPADVLRHADTAMYAAKTAGGGYRVWEPDLDSGRAERLSLLADLHTAVERGDEALGLHYQPKVDLRTGAVTGVEALVRWTHPRLGPLSPAAFVPLVESTGLVHPFTRHVLAVALRQCREWLDAGLDLSVAVNLSARNLGDADLPRRVGEALARAGVPADRLVLEITESAVMGDPRQSVQVLRRLADSGVTLSLDDFGTGHSSLSYLQRLPVHEVKVDRSFVAELTAEDPAARRVAHALVEGITGLARALELRVVAEGVEDRATLDVLRALGCDVVQGWHTGRPVPGGEIGRQVVAG